MKKIKYVLLFILLFFLTVYFKIYEVNASLVNYESYEYEKIFNGKSIDRKSKKDYIVVTDDEKSKEELIQVYDKSNIGDYTEINEEDMLHLENLSDNQVNMLEEMDDILFVEENYIANANRIDNKSMQAKTDEEWNLKMINADEIDKMYSLNDKIKVAVIDSGIDIGGDIPVYRSVNFIQGEENVSPLFADTTGHGTSVAGIIAALGNESGIKGINPHVELYSLKVLDDNNTSPVSRIIEAIYWCIENDINIINMSFGTPYYSVALKNAVNDAYNSNILMVASAGNNNDLKNNIEYPAAFDEVMSVGSVDSNGEIGDNCTKNVNVEIYAPGELVKSTGYFSGEIIVSGTSFAVPHIVGVASLLWEKDRSCSNQFIRELINVSANKKFEYNEGAGYSIVDVDYAFEIYEEFKDDYNDNIKFIDKFDKNEELDIDSSINYVEGRWYSSDTNCVYNHKWLSDNAAKETLGTDNSVVAKIVKLGATYPDKYKKDSDTLYGMGNNPQWHGNYTATNYFACYIYATKLALAGGDSTKVGAVFSRYQNDYNIMSKKVNQNGVCGRSWSTILKEFDYSNKSVSVKKLYRKYFIYGMAMHIATDIYAHSSYDYNINYIHHGNSEAGEHNYADDPYYLGNGGTSNRWKAAQGTAVEVFACMNGNSEGDLHEFVSQHKYFDGSFYLGNVMWYADGVGLSSYPEDYRTKLSKVATGRYIDHFIANY